MHKTASTCGDFLIVYLISFRNIYFRQSFYYLVESNLPILTDIIDSNIFSILKPSDELSDLREKKKRDEPSKGKGTEIAMPDVQRCEAR